MQERTLIFAGGVDHTSCACTLAQVLHEKLLIFFLVPRADVLSERRPHRFGEVDSLIEHQGPKNWHMIKLIESVERWRKKFG